MSPPNPDSLHGLLHHLVRSIGQMQMLDPSSGHAIAMSEALALHDLDTASGLSQQDLAASLCLDKSTVSRLVGGLSRRGLVSRERDPRNRRIVRLALTDAGRRLHGELGETLHQRQKQVLSGMTEAERSSLHSGLTALLRELHRSDAE